MPDQPPAPWGPVVGVFAANVLFAAGLFSHAFLYNFYLDTLGQGEAVMGVAASAMTGGGLVALAPAGLALDRWGPRLGYLAASVLAAAGLAAGAFAEAPLAIHAAAALAGAGAAAWRVTQGPVFMAVAPPRIRSRAFSWNVGLLLASGAAWTAASGRLPSLLGAGGEEGGALAGYRLTLVAGAALTLLAGVAFAALWRGSAAGAAGAAAAGAAGDRAAPSRAPSHSRPPLPSRVRLLAVLVFVWMTGAALVLPFFNLYFLRVHDLDVAGIGLLFAGVQALTAAVVFLGGEAAQRIGPARAFAGWAVVFPLALAPLAAGPALALAVALFVIQGLVPPATNPLLDELVLREAPPPVHGAASSWRNAATEASGLVGGVLGGLVLQHASFPALFLVAAAVAALGGALVLLTLRTAPAAAAPPA